MPTISPYKIDPTKTTTLRKRFVADIKRQFMALWEHVKYILIVEDALGLNDPMKVVGNTIWKFKPPAEKAKAFKEWLERQLDATLKGKTQEELWKKYLDEAHKTGRARAYEEVKRTPKSRTKEGAPAFKAAKDEFLKVTTVTGKHSLSIIGFRTQHEIHGVIDAMKASMIRVVTEGIVKEHSTQEIIKRLMGAMKIGKKKADTIARTEIIRAHAEGQLDAFDAMGVESVGAAVEWSTAGDGRVCPLCKPMEGMVFRIKEARGMIPRHPRCRCSWRPANIGEEETKQSKKRIDQAIRRSKRDDPKWGPAVPISVDRPTANLSPGVWGAITYEEVK